MDCNKDEAIRAKEIAEKKMQNNDFEAARKIAVRARNLYPELENITQLLCTCDVHCSAQKGQLGSEKDWYGILQIEKMADEPTVRKQYRRLALILHPDKNRFPGAESAFKLVCEANALLTDPTRKSLYDSKITVQARYASVIPRDNIKKNSELNKQTSARTNISNSYSSLSQHQATHPNSSVGQEVFWTSCPFCKTRYQYLKEFVRKSLCCPTCRKTFVAYEVSVQGNSLRTKSGQPGGLHVPPKPDSGQSAAFHEKMSPNRGNRKVGIQKEKKGPPASHVGSQGIASKQTVIPKTDVQMGIGSERVKKDVENLRTEGTGNTNTDPLLGGKKGGTSNGDATHGETQDLRNKSRKRVRQNVSYNEAEVDDRGSTLNRPRSAREDNVDEQKVALESENAKNGCKNSFPTNATVHSNGSLQGNGKDDETDEKYKVGGETGGNPSNDFHAVEIDEDKFSSDNSEIECPDPEFSDFDKARDETQFAVDQFWACYDNILDGMPRFYAKVKKVYFSPFELSITWLEAVPVDEVYEKWVDEDLPVGCGSFKLGKTEKSQARLSFSHQVHFEKGKKRGSLFMYPREGEVWALFKDWDMSWSLKPENHKEFKYEIVEVVSDFVPGFGIRVVYLDKVAGFVSLFKRASCQGENELFVIRPDEIYKFSHCVPFFKMTGSETEGVPIGSLELDPASLPLNPDDLYYPGKSKMEDIKIDCGEKGGKSVESEGMSTTPKNVIT